MRSVAKLIVIILSLFALAIVFGYIFDRSLIFPFTFSDDLYVPDHRLQAVRLGAASTFAYFGIRYIFYQSTKLYPIQFMGIFLFFLSTIGSISYYKNNVNISEYLVPLFFLISSIVLYQAGKPEFRSYFRK